MGRICCVDGERAFGTPVALMVRELLDASVALMGGQLSDPLELSQGDRQLGRRDTFHLFTVELNRQRDGSWDIGRKPKGREIPDSSSLGWQEPASPVHQGGCCS